MKRKLLTTAMKLARKKAHAKKYNQIYKSLSRRNIFVKGKKTDATYKFKQKPTTHSGIEIKTQKGTHYGIKGRPMKVNPRGYGAMIKRMPYVGSRETWGEEMHRMYGGVHMGQDRASVNKSMRILLGRKKRKKVKKAKRGKFFKKLGRAALAGAALYGASRLGTSKTLKGSKIINTVKTLPVTVQHIGFPEIENPWSIKYEFPKTLNDGGEIVIGKNVDKDLL